MGNREKGRISAVWDGRKESAPGAQGTSGKVKSTEQAKQNEKIVYERRGEQEL